MSPFDSHTPGSVLLHSGSALLINIEKGWSLFSSKITDSPFFFAGPHTHTLLPGLGQGHQAPGWACLGLQRD